MVSTVNYKTTLTDLLVLAREMTFNKLSLFFYRYSLPMVPGSREYTDIPVLEFVVVPVEM